MNSFKTLINELAETCKLNEIDRDAKVAKLIASLTNTMSDQGSVNPVFNSLMPLLPYVPIYMHQIQIC
jgi:hypothetical protein